MQEIQENISNTYVIIYIPIIMLIYLCLERKKIQHSMLDNSEKNILKFTILIQNYFQQLC